MCVNKIFLEGSPLPTIANYGQAFQVGSLMTTVLAKGSFFLSQ